MLKVAETNGWWTWAVVSSAGDVRVGGRRQCEGRFVAVWSAEGAPWCRWWTRDHEVVDQGWRLGPAEKVTAKSSAAALADAWRRDPAADRVHRWRTPQPFPEKVSVTELKKLLAGPVDSGLSEK